MDLQVGKLRIVHEIPNKRPRDAHVITSVRDALAYWTAREQMLGIFDTREHAEAYNAALVACLSEQFWGPAV